MVKEVERLNRAIGDLIGLSRPTDIRPRMTGMRRLIGDTLRLIGQDAANHKVAIRFDAPEAAGCGHRSRQDASGDSEPVPERA